VFDRAAQPLGQLPLPFPQLIKTGPAQITVGFAKGHLGRQQSAQALSGP
jgi:hypothetical protein